MNQTVDQMPLEYTQGTPQWFALRKTKIAATDSSIIMGVNPWKTPLQLYHEKLSNDPPKEPNEAMKRGIDLEPIARELYILKKGIEVVPRVIVNGWQMASLDGISELGHHMVEIKCPGSKDHAIALSGKIPEHYYPQLQHQMCVTGLSFMDYFSFDGTDGVIVKVDRDNEYIANMIIKESVFYECLINKIPPESTERDYNERSDLLWCECARRWKEVSYEIKMFENEQEDLRQQLIFLAGESNSKGAGVSLCHIQRKGNINYGAISELNNVDLEKYRKPSTSMWRIDSY